MSTAQKIDENFLYTPLKKLIGHQNFVLSLIHAKLELLNYWNDGYTNNLPILKNNQFLIFTSHIYYRSITLDFCALFCSGDSDKISFHKLNKYFPELPIDIQEKLTKILSKYDSNVSPIADLKALRNKQVAHYDPRDIENFSLNHEFLPLYNELIKVGRELIATVSKTFVPSMGFKSDKISKLRSFERLVKDAEAGHQSIASILLKKLTDNEGK